MSVPFRPGRFDPPHPVSRLAPAAALAVFILSLGTCSVVHARARQIRRTRHASIRRAVARITGPELSLHSASRWLRHPTRSEPWAASSDGPALLDVDPAGALAPPPVAVLRAGWPAVRITIIRR